MSNITVLWHEKESTDYTDIYPIAWFARTGTRCGIIHDVRGPRGGRYQAKCDLSVESTHADLDYAAHTRFNRGQGMFLGMQRLCFDSESRKRVTQVLWRDHQKKHLRSCTVTVGSEQQPDLCDLEFLDMKALSSVEGRARLVSHLRRERDPKLAKAKKAAVLRATGKLACEACRFVFSDKYGELGDDFCEVHHRIALSSTDETETALNDLAVICSNCHRMIHRTGDPMLRVEQFR